MLQGMIKDWLVVSWEKVTSWYIWDFFRYEWEMKTNIVLKSWEKSLNIYTSPHEALSKLINRNNK